ncbi:MAG TPA: ABC transporter permease [Ktedonobacterales bacterium]|nr:ABC transporter permease [Ktedonobacterales bacterium]
MKTTDTDATQANQTAPTTNGPSAALRVAPFQPIRRTLALTFRIVGQFRHDPRTLALLFIAPLVVMTVLKFALDSSSSSLTLAIVAPGGQAGVTLTDQLTKQLKAQGGITVKMISADKVDSTLKAGDADGVLIFPSDFFAQEVQEQTPTIKLRLEGSNPTAAQRLRQVVNLLIDSLQTSSPGASGGAQAGQTGANTSTAAISLTTSYLYGGPQYTSTDALAPLLIGLFAFIFVFLLTSVAFLRERSQGTLERLMVSPISRTEVVIGYVTGFTIFAFLQSALILLYVIYVLQVHYAGNLWLLFLVTLTMTVGGVNMGIFASAFARNELQVVQFIPLLLAPQVLLAGIFYPVNTLPVVLKQIAYVLPLTYANFALKDVMVKGLGFSDIWPDLLFLVGFAVLMIIGAAFSLRQERS